MGSRCVQHVSLPRACTVLLEIRWYGLQASDLDVLHLEQGEKPTVEGEVTNHSGKTFRGTVSRTLTGYGKEEYYDIEGDTLSLPFTTTAAHPVIDFEVSVDADTYALFTDVAISILTSSGNVVSKNGLGQSTEKIRFRPNQPGDYILEIQGALTHESPAEWSVQIDENHQISSILFAHRAPVP